MPPKKNAFMVFATEWRLENDPTMSIAEAVEKAGKVWEKMSWDEREPYREKCRLLRQQEQNAKKRST